MAYKDSSELATNSNYALGDYSFRIERSSVPGSSNDKIEAICTKDGKNARKSIQVPSSAQIAGWYVEANETEASVYIHLKGGLVDAVLAVADGEWLGSSEERAYGWRCPQAPHIAFNPKGSTCYLTQYAETIYAAQGTGSTIGFIVNETGHDAGGTWTAYQGSDVFVPVYGTFDRYGEGIPISTVDPNGKPVGYSMSGDKLVGRFAIELDDSGGVGPESDWTDPGDYDPDWEEGEPTHTLYVAVTGALSGRHNDPIEDPSYSYIPADKATVKDYGCGGDGGHGGGGGAGASTVVIHKFATNQANSKEVTAIARRHGYGSGGGKGGKGGDGCILVYY